ncbi:MAG: hypothetical protein SFY66_19805 [Oculatellaceae cyanobacterium bins.114]|nr:hypothetical protein [Oculatellaceae cyanobacterium bins.114]
MPLYTYLGVQTAITLPPASEGETPQEVQLIPHAQVELPEDLPYVQRAIAKNLLIPVEAPKPVKSRKSEAES